MMAVLAGCLATQIGPPAGSAPLRYRDAVFPNVTITTNLQYGTAPDLSDQPVALDLDLYRPAGDTVTRRPAIVWAHAGGFSGGDKSYEGPTVTPWAQEGYVVADIDYRLLAPPGCSGSSMPAACVTAATDAISDGQTAVRWLRAHAAQYGIDPTRIAFAGFSAGGIMATGVGVGTDPTNPTDSPGYSSKVQAWVSVSGGLPGGEGVSATTPPGYLFSGTADTYVPYQWSVDTANAMDEAGRAAVLYSEPGVGHTLPPLSLLTPQSTNFLYFALDLAHAAT